METELDEIFLSNLSSFNVTVSSGFNGTVHSLVSIWFV